MMPLHTSQHPPTGVKTADVRAVLFSENRPFTCKEVGAALGIDFTVERNLKALSNHCGFLVAKGQAERVGPGTYQQKGNGMTMTDMTPPALSAVPRASEPESEFVCHCGVVAKSQMGLRSHQTRAHKKALSPDEAFELTGRALEVLLPDGIPFSRVAEIAELQKHMLRVIK